MGLKDIYTEKDFEELDWHDCSINNITFPYETYRLDLELDYIFNWELNTIQNQYMFTVAPVLLTFEDVSDLKIELDFSNMTGLYIEKMVRENMRLSPNKKFVLWDYIIYTDKGILRFNSTSFTQTIKAKPKISFSQRYNTN